MRCSLQPRKRTRQTINPAMALKNGKPWVTFGTPGSDTQPVRIVPKGLRSFDAHDADFVGIRVVCALKELDKFKGLKSQMTRESPDYPEK